MADPNEPDYDRIRGVLERAVARVCPRQMAGQREDIVQAAMLRVLEAGRRREQNGIRTTSYLWQVAYTTTIDEIRRSSRRKEVALEEGREEHPAFAVQPGLAVEAERRHLGLEIQDCLARLIEPRRLAAILHLHGFRADESALALGWNVKRVQNLTYRALADLRRCLESKGIRP